jgi:hypothetical protein
MAMSRQDYALLAQVVEYRARAYDRAGMRGERDAVLALAEDLAQRLAQANPAFDRSRFLAACGYR